MLNRWTFAVALAATVLGPEPTAVAASPEGRIPEMIPVEALDLIGKPAPGFEAPLLNGGSFRLQEHRGSVVILSFWASWCGPCREELPALAALQKSRPDLKIFAVNVDREKSKAQAFLAQVPFDLPIVWDNEATALGQYEVLSMPTMFLIDRNQTLVWRKTGFGRDKGLSELEAQLQGVR